MMRMRSTLHALLLAVSVVVQTEGSTAQPPETPGRQAQLAQLINLDCDPCIDRKLHKLAALLPSKSGDGAIEASMEQAATDMNVALKIYYLDTDSDALEKAMSEESVNAWIVTLSTNPNTESNTALNFQMEATVTRLVEDTATVFGWGWGYASPIAAGAAGWIASNEAQASREAATEFYTSWQNIHNESLNLDKVAYVYNELQERTAHRMQAFQDHLELQVRNSTLSTTGKEQVQVYGKGNLDLISLFQGCPQQAILFDHPQLAHQALLLKQQHSCEDTLLATFLDEYNQTTQGDTSLYSAITRDLLHFVLDPQRHLQTSMAVVMAAEYITTAKKPSVPNLEASHKAYSTGPTLIQKRNVPSDTTAKCQIEAFPVCQEIDFQSNSDETTEANTNAVDWWGLDTCPCFNRYNIKIGAVLHGTPGGFWDPVFAAAYQAADDMHVTLDLSPFQSKEDFDLLISQMAARIRTLCESGVDGLVVSIPDPKVADAVQRCLDLHVPVISVNSGAQESKNLGLLHHIGQNEYAGGYEAAQRLIQAGMKKGFCVDHEFGNIALAERCQGFRDGILDFGKELGVEFIEHIAVPRDNQEQFRLAVTQAVQPTTNNENWEGIGFLQLAASSFPSLRTLLDEHKGAVAGAFDLKDYIYDAIGEKVLLFTVDQQPYLQGNLPIYLLTYFIQTRQALSNHLIESGPSFIDVIPSEEQKICEANNFAVCPDRPPEDMSYIPDSLLAVGYALFGLILVFACVALAWSHFFRDFWVVKVSQPMFLWLVILGTVISSLSIVFLGAQTSYRQDRDESGEFLEEDNPEIKRVDASCMAVPWLFGIGFAITFSALFAKILRVKLMFELAPGQQRGGRNKPVTLAEVLPVMAFMMVVEIVILTSFTIVAPLRWEREVTDELNGFPIESVGSCQSGVAGNGFWGGLIGFHIVCLCYALILCWQTRNISSDLAESSYVSLAVAFVFQVLVLAVPVVALVQDNSVVFYFVQMAVVFLQNFTVLALIFVPKMLRTHEASSSGGLGDKSKMSPTPMPMTLGKKANTGGTGSNAMVKFPSSKGSGTSEKEDKSKAYSSEKPGVVPFVADKKVDLPTCSWGGMNLSVMDNDLDRSENNNRHSSSGGGLAMIGEDEESVVNNSDSETAASESHSAAGVESRQPITDSHRRAVAAGANMADIKFLTSDEVLSRWDELGLPTEFFARQLVDLMSMNTDSVTRQSIVARIDKYNPKNSESH